MYQEGAVGGFAWLPIVVVAMARSMVDAKIVQKRWEGPNWEGVWPCLDPWDVVRLRTSSTHWNVQVKYGPHSEFFLLPHQEGAGGSRAVQFNPFVSAETLKRQLVYTYWQQKVKRGLMVVRLLI